MKGVFDSAGSLGSSENRSARGKLKVIGEGPHRTAVMDQFAARNLMDGVEFTGGIGEEDKNRLLAEARLGLAYLVRKAGVWR